MARPQPALTPAVEQSILAYIRAGGFPHVAAEAAGISRDLFEHWLRCGQGPRASPQYRAFFEAVQQAIAQARLGAEVAALKGKPLDWLKYGPGKETAQSAGWTTTVKAQPAHVRSDNPFLQPEMQDLLRTLLDALAPFPEARAALAQAIAQTPT